MHPRVHKSPCLGGLASGKPPGHLRRHRFNSALAIVVGFFICAGPLVAQELRKAAAVRNLSAEEAGRHLPVRLRGVVTFFNENLYSRFVQDETAGIYLRESTNTPPLIPGQLVEISGRTSPGEYAPIVEPQSIRIVGNAPLPVAQPVTFGQLASGSEDSQFVEVIGIVRAVQFVARTGYYAITLVTGGGRLTAYARELPVKNVGDLVDASLRVRGVCATQFNRQRQLFAIDLMVPRVEDLHLEQAALADPFSVATLNLGSLLQFSPEATYGHRVKVAGTVTYHRTGIGLYLQDAEHGLQVQTSQTEPALKIGDRVEALGFTAQGPYTPLLEDATCRIISTGPQPQPTIVNLDEALTGKFDCRLVRLKAKLLDRARQSREQFLVLEAGNFIFHAHLDSATGVDSFAKLENGSTVFVTGVCRIEPGEWEAGENWRAKSFQLLLRSRTDVAVIQLPPWWDLKKLLWMTLALGLVVLAAAGWVVILRRRVQQQTGIIRRQLEVEATLKERYVDLFENANDMVFTHNLTGRITSVNRAGERLLGRGRDKFLNASLVSLVAEEQRPAAQHWIEQVVQGGELPAAEWDFLSAAGQRVKLEISTRLIALHGRPPEVEGIARDITERRRLERELLEISNREQRRIGHDLHDGVCQQLAGIAYRLDVLGDQLQEQGTAEAAEAGKIASLINEATVQARSVARGLFPVRLEEAGLVASLEELAAGAASRFRMECLFECASPPAAVDNEAALHLYYIAQEAVLNAFKHGRARRVMLSLQPEGPRFRLSVRDNGVGFQPGSTSVTGMGMRIMHYRAKVIGATLEVRSDLAAGTQVTCVFFPAGRETVREVNHA
jgi:PAS domain S-box-containing protein